MLDSLENKTASSDQEQQLRLRAEHAEKQLARLLATMPCGYATLNRDWIFTFANQQAVRASRQRLEDFVGKNIWTIWPRLAGTEIEPQFRQVMETGVPAHFESFGRTYDAWFEMHVYPIEDGIGVYFQETTQRRRAEEALIQSEKLAAVGRLASSISHEINNPLEAVTNLLYLALNDEELPPTTKRYLETAQGELARVSHIATQSLRFHRQTIHPAYVDPKELIDSVLDLYQGRLLNSNIRVVFKHTSTKRILCFENDIRQILNNLIANALDAMRQGGRLVLRSGDGTDWKTGRSGVKITVADTGHGMSAEVQKRVFEPFYTTKEVHGTGLGLWITRGIVSRHHGSLALKSSEKPGRNGTVFTLFLPDEQNPSTPTQ